MEFEKDYVMRMIKEIVRALAKMLFGKTTPTYEPAAEDTSTDTDLLYQKAIQMADSGKINEAENLLFREQENGGVRVREAMLAFYAHINEFSDEFLKEHDYSREEIVLGIQSLAKEMGYGEVVDTLLQ